VDFITIMFLDFTIYIALSSACFLTSFSVTMAAVKRKQTADMFYTQLFVYNFKEGCACVFQIPLHYNL